MKNTAKPFKDGLAKRLLAVVMSAFVILTMVPSGAFALTNDNFVACITIGGDENVLCKFKIITEPTAAHPNGTAQIGNGIGSAIPKDTVGRLEFPDTVAYNGNTYDVTTIGPSAFENCDKLSGDLIIPNDMTAIGDNAFGGCLNLRGRLHIGDRVTSIGEGAFSGCTNLVGNLTIPNGVGQIGDSAFSNCSQLSGALTIPDGVTKIGAMAFINCTGLTSVTMGNGVTEIGDAAFQTCSKFTSATILSTEIAIGADAFKNCSQLTQLQLGAVPPKSIEASAFANGAAQRKLILRDENGAPLTGEAFDTAVAAYNSVAGNNTWNGWTIPTQVAVDTQKPKITLDLSTVPAIYAKGETPNTFKCGRQIER